MGWGEVTPGPRLSWVKGAPGRVRAGDIDFYKVRLGKAMRSVNLIE